MQARVFVRLAGLWPYRSQGARNLRVLLRTCVLTRRVCCPPLHISTGVVAPRVLKTVDVIEEQEAWRPKALPEERHVTVDLVVEAQGFPSQIKVVEPADEGLNREVVKSVGQYRFTPDYLNAEPTAVPMTLRINVRPPVE